MEAPKTPMHPRSASPSAGMIATTSCAPWPTSRNFIERGPDHIGLCSGGGAVGATVIQHRPVRDVSPAKYRQAPRSGTRPYRADTRRAVGLLRSGPSSRARPPGCNTSTRSTLPVWQMRYLLQYSRSSLRINLKQRQQRPVRWQALAHCLRQNGFWYEPVSRQGSREA